MIRRIDEKGEAQEMCWQNHIRGNKPVDVESLLDGKSGFEEPVSESGLLDDPDNVQEASQPVS